MNFNLENIKSLLEDEKLKEIEKNVTKQKEELKNLNIFIRENFKSNQKECLRSQCTDENHVQIIKCCENGHNICLKCLFDEEYFKKKLNSLSGTKKISCFAKLKGCKGDNKKAIEYEPNEIKKIYLKAFELIQLQLKDQNLEQKLDNKIGNTDQQYIQIEEEQQLNQIENQQQQQQQQFNSQQQQQQQDKYQQQQQIHQQPQQQQENQLQKQLQQKYQPQQQQFEEVKQQQQYLHQQQNQIQDQEIDQISTFNYLQNVFGKEDIQENKQVEQYLKSAQKFIDENYKLEGNQETKCEKKSCKSSKTSQTIRMEQCGHYICLRCLFDTQVFKNKSKEVLKKEQSAKCFSLLKQCPQFIDQTITYETNNVIYQKAFKMLNVQDENNKQQNQIQDQEIDQISTFNYLQSLFGKEDIQENKQVEQYLKSAQKFIDENYKLEDNQETKCEKKSCKSSKTSQTIRMEQCGHYICLRCLFDTQVFKNKSKEVLKKEQSAKCISLLKQCPQFIDQTITYETNNVIYQKAFQMLIIVENYENPQKEKEENQDNNLKQQFEENMSNNLQQEYQDNMDNNIQQGQEENRDFNQELNQNTQSQEINQGILYDQSKKKKEQEQKQPQPPINILDQLKMQIILKTQLPFTQDCKDLEYVFYPQPISQNQNFLDYQKSKINTLQQELLDSENQETPYYQ